MLSVLIEGTLTAAPVQRTSARGQRYVTAQMRATADDGDSILCSLIAFHASAADALAALAVGDTVAVAGPAAISHWEKDGTPRTGLKVTATRVLTVYDAGMRRRAASQGDRPERQDQPDRLERPERPDRPPVERRPYAPPDRNRRAGRPDGRGPALRPYGAAVDDDDGPV